ncbi:unnamed protein product [Caretta caretta]
MEPRGWKTVRETVRQQGQGVLTSTGPANAQGAVFNNPGQPQGLREGNDRGEASTHARGQAVWINGVVNRAVQQMASEVVSEVFSAALQHFQRAQGHPEPGCSPPLSTRDGSNADPGHVRGMDNGIADALSCFQFDRLCELAPGTSSEPEQMPLALWNL